MGREEHKVEAGGKSGGRRAVIRRFWDGDGRRPGGRVTPCGVWIFWDRDGRRSGGWRNL